MTFRKTPFIILGLIIVSFLPLYYKYISHNAFPSMTVINNKEMWKLPQNQMDHFRNDTKKRILFYTSFYGSIPWSIFDNYKNYSNVYNCFKGCEMTYNLTDFERSHFVIFHARNMPGIKRLEQLKKKRPRDQLWAYFTLENPLNAPPVKHLGSLFDLSISYRLDADIHFPYRVHFRVPWSQVKLPRKTRNYAANKTKQVAWAVSSCGLLRDNLIKILHHRGIQIDNYGSCDVPFTNKVNCSDDACSDIKHYKFYYAAENNFCEEYVSEKYWYTSIDNDAIPIVLGSTTTYANPRLAIPGSYIEAMKFASPDELAEHLLQVDKNDELFNGYLKWKPYWNVLDEQQGYSISMCKICEKLHTNSFELKGNSLLSSIQRDECLSSTNYYRDWIKSKTSPFWKFFTSGLKPIYKLLGY